MHHINRHQSATLITVWTTIYI